MAVHGAVEVSPDLGDDYETRLRNYRSFLLVLRYCVAGVAVILIFLAGLAWMSGR